MQKPDVLVCNCIKFCVKNFQQKCNLYVKLWGIQPTLQRITIHSKVRRQQILELTALVDRFSLIVQINKTIFAHVLCILIYPFMAPLKDS